VRSRRVRNPALPAEVLVQAIVDDVTVVALRSL
jgi:hypothetical protein